MKTAERINELLKLKGWSQAELARQLGVTASRRGNEDCGKD
nr:MAG TPA: regulatory protein [Caudoviricetes sp.]